MKKSTRWLGGVVCVLLCAAIAHADDTKLKALLKKEAELTKELEWEEQDRRRLIARTGEELEDRKPDSLARQGLIFRVRNLPHLAAAEPEQKSFLSRDEYAFWLAWAAYSEQMREHFKNQIVKKYPSRYLRTPAGEEAVRRDVAEATSRWIDLQIREAVGAHCQYIASLNRPRDGWDSWERMTRARLDIYGIKEELAQVQTRIDTLRARATPQDTQSSPETPANVLRYRGGPSDNWCANQIKSIRQGAGGRGRIGRLQVTASKVLTMQFHPRSGRAEVTGPYVQRIYFDRKDNRGNWLTQQGKEAHVEFLPGKEILSGGIRVLRGKTKATRWSHFDPTNVRTYGGTWTARRDGSSCRLEFRPGWLLVRKYRLKLVR